MGLGYIGLPTALLAAEKGFRVLGYDIDQSRVERINTYDPTIAEPEVAERLAQALDAGLFRASTKLEPADYVIIAVPTPFTKDKKADVSHVYAAGQALAGVLTHAMTVIVESTVPVGTTEKLTSYLEQATGLVCDRDFYSAYCPERVLPGKIFSELVSNPRVIGGTARSSEQVEKFYAALVHGQLCKTDAATAELVKLIENSSRDVSLAFAQQVAAMTRAAGRNPYEVIELANKHPRVNILHPRCGVGGHCIAVDPWFLLDAFPQQAQLLHAARMVNDQVPRTIFKHIKQAIREYSVRRSNEVARAQSQPFRIMLLGATYKPDVDDLRESPALAIAKLLLQDQASSCYPYELRICEPHVTESMLHKQVTIPICNFEEGISWADSIVCLVDHTVFKNKKAVLACKENVLDFCGLLYQEQWALQQHQHCTPKQSRTYQSKYEEAV